MSEQKRSDIQETLRQMREEYWQGIEQEAEAAAGESLEYLIFGLAGERFGIPTGQAREVLRVPRLVRVPKVAAHILGVFNLRGQVVAVTDLRYLLGLSQREVAAEGQLVVVEGAGLLTALRVDRVEGIQEISMEGIEPLTEGLTHFPREAVTGQIVDGGGLLVLLDLEQILSRPELVVDHHGS